MRLGGIDPSILRELSGVYKPFVKAFKELISNAFDADAEHINVEFSPDFTSVTIADDGCGMTPFEFRNDFTRIGGGSRRWTGDRTRKGRLRIGSKGIGFLALARYCGSLKVESSADRTFKSTVHIAKASRTLDLRPLIGLPLDGELLEGRLACRVSRTGRRQFRSGKDYKVHVTKQRLVFTEDPGDIELHIEINCQGLAFSAILDFDRLLQLADNADLEAIEDFATIELTSHLGKRRAVGTKITAAGLKPFVCRELKADRRKGFVRNIGGRSGLDQFVWHLSRCTPIRYVEVSEAGNIIAPLISSNSRLTLNSIIMKHGDRTETLNRPIYPFEKDAPVLPSDMVVDVKIDQAGLRATGFLAAYENVIFPAEYRGISIRVRGVAIGEPGFLGAEHLLTGANKAALSQITGEIVVHKGLDAVDTLNPGRESFYEESEQYKILRRHLVGDGEHMGGFVGRAITAVLRRSQVRSALGDVLGRMAIRRQALEDVSAAITNIISREDLVGDAIRKMLRSKHQHVNGLVSAADHTFPLPPRIGGLAVTYGERLAEPAEIDYIDQKIRLDRSRPEWSGTILLHDRRFEIIHKKGKSDQAIAEMDLKRNRIYINWGHPIKLQMDERGFLRCALAFVVAKEAPCGSVDQTMNLALQLLSFATRNNG